MAPSSGKPYINLGFYPCDEMGAFARFMTPSTPEGDAVLFGAKASNNQTWYFGGNKSYYLSWNSNPDNTKRPFLKRDGTGMYDVFLNYLNDRNRKIAGVNGSKISENEAGPYDLDEYSLAIEPKLNGGNVLDHKAYLFNFNNQGTPYNRYQFYRLYSARFTLGDKVMMDLIPVRKGGMAYVYDKVSNRLLGKDAAATGAFEYPAGDKSDGAYIERNITLDADADWTSRGILRIDGGAKIDLNGHKLIIAGAYGDGDITNSSDTLGEIHFDVPEKMNQKSSLRLSGNLKVVKKGAGSLALVRAGQTFTGGVVVEEGTAYAPQSGYPEQHSFYGPEGGTITIRSGATFDSKGNDGYGSKRFILDGGTLANTGDAMAKFDSRIFSHIELTADSRLDAGSTVHLWSGTGETAPHIDLGGHTLTVSITESLHLYLNAVIQNGTLHVERGGYLTPSPKSGASVKHGSDTLDLRMTGGALDIKDDLHVRNYYAGYLKHYNTGTADMFVHGTFTPAAVDEQGNDYFYGCTMIDGSRIDLSARSTAWSTSSTGFSDGKREVSFADNATVTVYLGNRRVRMQDKVMDWSAAVPENLETLTFTGVYENGYAVKLTKMEDGLYGAQLGMRIIVR